MENYGGRWHRWSIAEESLHGPNKTEKGKIEKKENAKSCLVVGILQMILPKAKILKSPKEIWDYLKGKYEGNEKIRSMKVLNLIRKFDLQRIKEFETIK